MPRTRNNENCGYPKGWRFRYDAYYYRVPQDQEHLWEDGEKSRATGSYEIRVFRQVFTKAVEWGILDRHPFKGEVHLRGLRARNRYVEDW
jgi:hypothetical protein